MKALLERLKEALKESALIVERSEADLMNLAFDLKRAEQARLNRYDTMFEVEKLANLEDRH